MILKIDEEFRNKIPPLTEDEFRQLEENIVSDGEVYEPIAVWNGTIVDGHNRWKIIQAHPEIPYKVREMDFPDKWAAFEWMYKKQLGRRNLTEEQKTYMIGKMYEARKNTQGGNRGTSIDPETGRFTANGQNVHLRERYEIKQGTAGQIGKEFGIDGKTVRRAEKFAKGVDAVRKVSEEAADKILTGEAAVTKTSIGDLVGKDKKTVKAVAETILNGGSVKKPRLPNVTKRTFTEEEPEAQISRGENNAVYSIDDLLEEMRAVNEDFLGKYRRMLKFHADLISANASEVTTVMAEVRTEFEKMEEF